MNFIKERALLEKQIDELIKSREEVFNETLQDMLKAAIANYTGKDNSDGPTLPKTPSTCRRLRNRQQRKRKQPNDRSQNDGSPQLSRTLRSNVNKRKQSDATTNEVVSTPLDNISNKMDSTDQTVETVRKSSRQCAVKATQAITQQTGRKKGSRISRKCSDGVSDGTAPQLLSASFSEEHKVIQLQESSPLLQQDNTLSSHHDEHVEVDTPSLKKVSQGILESNSDDHTTTDDTLNISVSPKLPPVPFLHCPLKNTEDDRQQQEANEDPSATTEEIPFSSIVADGNKETTCNDKEPTIDDDNATTRNDESPVLTTKQFFTPLVVNCAHPVPSATIQMVSESSCLNETRTISGPQEDSDSDDNKFSTSPSDVSTGVIEESKPTDGIRRVTTVIKKDAATEKADQTIINNGPSVNLALLTKLTPPLDSNPGAMQTPATVMKDCFTKNYSTVIKGCPTSGHTVAETPATITKVSSNSNSGPNANLADEQNDGSPELTVIRKPQGCPAGNSYTASDATKKQITPTNNAFSPAKFKSTVPLEPSGLLYSNHAPPKVGLGGYKKLPNKAEQMQKAKEKLAEKNRRDKERLQQLEKKKEQERLEKKRRNQEQLRKVQERQALMLKKKEAQKMQVQQKIAATDLVSVEEVKATKDTEKPLYEMPKYKDQGKKLKEDFYSATCESDEEHYWEEEKRKRDNCKDYNYHVQKEMEEAILEKKRMCSVDKMPVISSDEGYTSTTTGLTSLYSNSCMGDVDDDDVDYGLDDLNSDDSTDEEDNPRKPIPQWAQDNKLLAYIKRQEERPLNSSMAIFSGEADPVNLGRIFKRKKQRFFKRTSSAQWGSPPAKANDNDWIV